jgi:hypothetical protein
MDEEISCEKKQGYDVISGAEATLGDEETSDIKNKPGPGGKFCSACSLVQGILELFRNEQGGVGPGLLLAATRNHYFGER